VTKSLWRKKRHNLRGAAVRMAVKVRSVTVWNRVYKLRRASQLLAPTVDFSWLTEIEKDLALVMEPDREGDQMPRRRCLRATR
jgi:hypothetical protein